MPDYLKILPTPLLGKIDGPAGARGGEEAGDFDCAGDGPGHPLAGEGLDVAAGIADGQDAITAEGLPAAGEQSRAAQARGFERFGKIAAAGAEDLRD